VGLNGSTFRTILVTGKNNQFLAFWTVLVTISPSRIVEANEVAVLVDLGGAPGLDVVPPLDAARLHLAVQGEGEDALDAVISGAL